MTPTAKLDIGIFTDDFYPESGGVSRSIQLQVQYLSRAGHRVTLFAPRIKFTPPQEADWVGPVSYTHLDVYKRQLGHQLT